MKSPFPGVDPYLLNRWGDARMRLVVYTRDRMNQTMPDKGFVARCNRDEITSTPFIDTFQRHSPKRLITRLEFPPPLILMQDESVNLVTVCFFGPSASITTWRSWKGNNAETRPVSVREPVPRILIPLLPDGDEYCLDLQTILDDVYERGDNLEFDYQEDPDPPLEGHDAEWANALLRKAGKRK
jgi:Protein of unknown function (DUF4058)